VLAPALYDAHIHLFPGMDLRHYPWYGVARIRDLGSLAGAGQPIPTPSSCADPIPEIVLGGPLFDRPGKPRLAMAVSWNDPADLPALFDAVAHRRTSWVKLYDRFPTHLFDTAVRLAHERGMRVTLHPGPGDYPAAIEAGIDELQHLPSLIPPGASGTHALHQRWADRQANDTWPELPAGTAVCPTLLVQRQLVREAEQRWQFPGHDPRFAEFWRGLRLISRPWTDQEIDAARSTTDQVSATVRRLTEAGVRWVIGTDTPNPGLRAGESMWHEMNLLIAAGLEPLTVYQTAAISNGITDHGSYPLTMLPLSTFEHDLLTVQPAQAVLLRGCLFQPVPETETRGHDRHHHNRHALSAQPVAPDAMGPRE
jgi:hypothetical protein